MNRSELESIVIATLAATLRCAIDANSSRENTSLWDSLKHIEVVFALEDELRVEFSEQEQGELTNVQSVVDLVMKKNAA